MTDVQLAEQLRVSLGRLGRCLRVTHVGSNLSLSQREVLMAIVRSDSIRLSELARQEGLNPTMLSRIVTKLEAAELIVRAADPLDARVVHVTPTKKALALRDTIRNERTDALLYALDGLSKDERTSLAVVSPILDILVARMRERDQ